MLQNVVGEVQGMGMLQFMNYAILLMLQNMVGEMWGDVLREEVFGVLCCGVVYRYLFSHLLYPLILAIS